MSRVLVRAEIDPGDLARLQEAADLEGVPVGMLAAELAEAGLLVHRAREARILRPRSWGPGVPPQGAPK